MPSLVRRLLFVWQTNWYGEEVLMNSGAEGKGSKGKREETLESVIAVAMKGMFGVDETIKPVVSYLAANLHERASLSYLLTFVL